MSTFRAFHGRTDSTTETYAYVVYHFMMAQSGNVQRLAKRRQERTYRLDLRLAGLDVDGVSMVFNRNHALNPLQEAQASMVKTNEVLSKVEAGVISPDEGAQELGYDSWYDPTLIENDPEAAKRLRAKDREERLATGYESLRFRFDKNSQSYKHVPEVIEIFRNNKFPVSSSSNGH